MAGAPAIEAASGCGQVLKFGIPEPILYRHQHSVAYTIPFRVNPSSWRVLVCAYTRTRRKRVYRLLYACILRLILAENIEQIWR